MKLFVLVSILSLVAACGGGSSGSGPISTDPAALQDKLQGNWERRGYGQLLNISGRTLTSYDFTSETCVLLQTDTVDDFDGAQLSDDAQTLVIGAAPLTFAERYTKLDSLPLTCSTPLGDTPSEIYDHVWHTFNEYYAFFDERQVDWLTQWDVTRDRISDSMSESELFSVLAELITPLDDEHVSLRVSDETAFNPASPKGFLAQLLAEFESQTQLTDPNDFIARELNRSDTSIRQLYLDGDVETAGDQTFIWGTIGEDIAYLRINAMLLNFETEIYEQVEEAEMILDQALTDLQDTGAMIVDVRLNGGGADPFALAIARRFADTERTPLSKFTRTVDGEGDRYSVTIGPVNRPSYQKPVVLITSGFTTSAAEVFTLAMRAWPHVTHIGEFTNGALSDVLSKPLPNGWSVELANEVYVDADGNSFEATGIPPAIETPIFRAEERAMGQDSGLNAALQYLGFDI